MATGVEGITGAMTVRGSSANLACDACRLRKKRCIRQTAADTGRDRSDIPCFHCVAAGTACTMIVPHQRRGPKLGSKRRRDTDAHTSDERPVTGPSTSRSPTPANPAVPRHPGQLLGGFPAFMPKHMVFELVREYRASFRCITPTIHLPSLLKDLERGREMLEDQEDWTAFVMAFAAMTLLVLPTACHEVSHHDKLAIIKQSQRFITDALASPRRAPSLERATTLACMSFMETIAGNTTNAREFHGRLYALLLELRLHDPQTYLTLNERDQELSLRVWWSFYCSDRAIACFEGNHCLIAESHAPTLRLPTVLGDEMADDTKHSLAASEWLDGFRYSIPLYQCVGPILEKRSASRVAVPKGSDLYSLIGEVQAFLRDVERFQESLPTDLRANDGGAEASPMMAIHRSNLNTSVQSLLYFGAQYLGELYVLEALQNVPTGSSISSRSVSFFFAQRASDNQESVKVLKRAIWTDTLHLLQTISISSLAVSSLPGLWKIRYIAAGLLDDLDESLVPGIEEPEERQSARVQLVEYLKLLSALQEQISLEHVAQGVPG